MLKVGNDSEDFWFCFILLFSLERLLFVVRYRNTSSPGKYTFWMSKENKFSPIAQLVKEHVLQHLHSDSVWLLMTAVLFVDILLRTDVRRCGDQVELDGECGSTWWSYKPLFFLFVFCCTRQSSNFQQSIQLVALTKNIVYFLSKKYMFIASKNKRYEFFLFFF